MKTVYLTIDIQRDYFPSGKFPLFRAQTALNNTLKILKWAREQNAPIYHIRHQGNDQARFLRAGTPGVELHPRLQTIQFPQESLIDKKFPDAFLGTNLEDLLQEQKPECVVWMGMMTWMCVDTTVRSAKAKGFNNILIGDACASGWMLRTLPVFPWSSQRSFLAALSYHHAQVLTARQYLKAVSTGHSS